MTSHISCGRERSEAAGGVGPLSNGQIETLRAANSGHRQAQGRLGGCLPETCRALLSVLAVLLPRGLPLTWRPPPVAGDLSSRSVKPSLIPNSQYGAQALRTIWCVVRFTKSDHYRENTPAGTFFLKILQHSLQSVIPRDRHSLAPWLELDFHVVEGKSRKRLHHDVGEYRAGHTCDILPSG